MRSTTRTILYRPRRPEELDTALGGGAIFNQAAHQIDIVRLLGGGRVESVRAATGAWDRTRPTEGAYAALLMFANGAFASLTYSGYGNFDSDEFQGWIGEMGQKKEPYAGPPRHHFDNEQDEVAFKNARNYGGPDFRSSAGQDLAHQHFGTLLVSCERADLRALPNGVMIYQNGSAQLDALPAPKIPRVEVIDELYDAVVGIDHQFMMAPGRWRRWRFCWRSCNRRVKSPKCVLVIRWANDTPLPRYRYDPASLA